MRLKSDKKAKTISVAALIFCFLAHWAASR
jgi:hypothetical protein